VEGVFWAWMESVIDAKRQVSADNNIDTVGSKGAGSTGVGPSDNVLAAYEASRLIDSHHSLQQAILKYESIVEHLERVCEEKVGTTPNMLT